ncbi:hypothetical protein AcV7_003110 [Taiwanofungus camphoratus]|nr:hypothetical protein AcV7_003110 [Antrodia cinnamomea]
MLDGTRLKHSWYTQLDAAQTDFRQLLASHTSSDWKRLTIPGDNSSTNKKGKARASSFPELADVILHRRTVKGGENVYRAVLDVPAGEEAISLEGWKCILVTPELRKEWDPAVESAHLIEMPDQATRISKVNFTLGWPANPRDAVTISRTFNDATTLIDISTSLPRSPDEPAYLRPSPPYVRSNVALFAWCVQHIQPQSSEQPSKNNPPSNGKFRVTCFWQHNLKAMWTFNSSSSIAQQLCAMMVGLFKTVKKRGARIPLLSGYGNGVSIERVRFEIDREALTLDYSIVPEDEDHASHTSEQGLDELHAIREHRRLTRSIECALPVTVGWDVQIATRASSEQVSQLPWTARATRCISASQDSSSSADERDQIILAVKHGSLPNDHSVLKVKVVIELSGPSGGIRLNGIPQAIEQIEDRNSLSYYMSEQMLQDASSTADLSFNTQSSIGTINESASRSSTLAERPQLMRVPTERTAGAEKTILSRVKRNYIYFSSLLQEPEAKWKRTVETRGVSVAQLDSIDPTLVVYRAEATFVGLGLWDLYSAIVTPGARAYWDKLYDDGILLEQVNELTELWHFKIKPTWPVNGRDGVVLKTVYKSPTTIHVFAFSADDPNLFPNIPPADPSVIRTQIDLQGWAIEALSPTATQLTLLEQSDPKGWSNKASIPQQMITAVAGAGEFAIKCGGPPVATRLEGAKATQMRYDHERGSFRLEYEGCSSRRTSDGQNQDDAPSSPAIPVIECELRCDLDSWASSLDIVVDPPPQSISCLRRHRLSSGGGGLWLTVTHDAVYTGEDRLQVIIRRGPIGIPKERGLVMVNGAKVDVDVEELADREVKNLQKRRRVKPMRVPLDQPPVLGVIRRRRAEWNADADDESVGNDPDRTPASSVSEGTTSSSPRFATSFGRFLNFAVEQATATTQAVAAITPAMAGVVDASLLASKPPMQYAIEALAYLQSVHAHPNTDGWALVSEKDFPIYRKLESDISPVIPMHKGQKVIEGVSAEELASVLTSYDCRKQWDTRFDSAYVFEVFGAECHTAFVVSKGGFPFRDRGFYLASLMARESPSFPPSRRNTGESEQSNDARAAIFCVSASFSPDSVSSFSPSKYNSYALPIGRVFVDGWILETLDPYGAENYAIPSARCTRVVAADFAGSVPAGVNSIINGMLPKSILAVEAYIKGVSPPPFTRLPAAGVVVSRFADDTTKHNSWTVRRRDPNTALIATKYNPMDRTYSSSIILYSSIALASSPLPNSNDKTPKGRRMTLGSRAASPTEGHESQRHNSRDDNPSTASSQQATPSAKGRSRSRDALRSSHVFTARGEVRHPTDLLVSELIVDSKLYSAGYEVRVNSRIDRARRRISLTPPSDDILLQNLIPFSCSAFTLPPSPLHSSGLNTDRPPRHLLRFTLPTAQYQVSTIQDPLTGETRSAPPKPQWLLDIEDGRVIFDIVIRPAPASRASKKPTVTVDGTAITVLSEKESLTSLGRDDLLDSRISKMDLLSGFTAEADQFPEELQTPIAVADHLLDASALALQTVLASDTKEPENAMTTQEASQDIADSQPQVVVSQAETPAADSAASSLLRFLNSYPNPLLRFTAQSRRPSGNLTADAVESSPSPSSLGVGEANNADVAKSASQRIGLISQSAVVASPTYPLSTVVIIALIAFLMGSFLRSLLSPADFIYVVTDRKEIDHARTGWREIKRLLEVKYMVGGWDFQIAVVRRH